MNLFGVTVAPETERVLERLGVHRLDGGGSWFIFEDSGAEILRALPEGTNGRLEDTEYGPVMQVGSYLTPVSHLIGDSGDERHR
jgi:hypothetical protein